MLGYRRDTNNNNNNVNSTQLYLLDVCLNQLAYKVDTSFATINAIFNTINARFNTIDTNITQISYLSFVNNVNQTFYEVITQQPYKFDKNDISLNSSSIVLRWNYDSIIAKHDNNNIAKLANIFDYTQYLPFINNIFIDISGFVGSYNNINYNIYNNTWINLDIIDITSDYNVNEFKQYIFQRNGYINSTDLSDILINNIIVNNMPFSIRVYGENYSNDYPTIESRSLIFNNLIFSNANYPSIPLFINSNASRISNSNVNNITLTYFNTLSDISNALSSAYLSNYIIDYSLNDTLASTSLASTSLANIENNIISITGNFSNIISSNSNFNIIITNLMSGAKYEHRVKVRNNFSNIYSDYSTISSSKYTLLPDNNNIETSINISIDAQCYKYVSTSNLNNSNVLYFNIANAAHSFRFSNSSSQVFQITHPYFINQELEANGYGYGKFIDNSFNLVTINLSINSVVKHIINYGGFNTNPSLNPNLNPYNYSKTDYGNVFILDNTTNTNIQDIYADISNVGFRLKGYLLLKDIITNTNIINYFGNPSINPYIMEFNYIRSTSVSTSNSSYNTYNIYIDELNGNPNISNINNSILIQEVIYNMSVASVKYFKLALARTYSNINSIYKYIVGNRIIADFSSTNTILTSFTRADIILAQSGINTNGIYNYDLCYNIAYYQQVKNYYSFNLSEKVYNLNGNISSNISLATKPFCDYNSFNKSNNIIDSNKLNLNTLHIYEISNIELIGSNLNNIVLRHYNNHNNVILSCTLLYLNSYFNNVFSSYPNSSDFSYNNNSNLDILYNTYGNISYDLTGNVMDNNQGYKWIVLKIFKDSSDINNSYLFNDISYAIITTSDGNYIRYLPLKTMFKNNNLFLHSIVDKIFDITDNTALMFGHATTITSDKRYFNIKQNFNGLGGIWTENSTSNNISYNITANSKIFGSNVYAEGIYCPINNLNNDLTIYIGLKESSVI